MSKVAALRRSGLPASRVALPRRDEENLAGGSDTVMSVFTWSVLAAGPCCMSALDGLFEVHDADELGRSAPCWQ